MKTSLTLLLSRSNGEQLTRLADSEGNRQSLLQTYRYDYLKAEPKIIWSPADVFEAEYHATLGYGGSKIGSDTRLTPLLDFVQRLHLTFSIGQVDLRLSGEHYRNDLGGDAHLNTVFADASLIYKRKKWRLEASLNNLFNKKKKRVCLHNIFHHAKLHFTTKYTSEGSNGDDKSSVLSLQYHHRGIYQYPNHRQSAHQYGSINMGDFLHGLIPADFQKRRYTMYAAINPTNVPAMRSPG